MSAPEKKESSTKLAGSNDSKKREERREKREHKKEKSSKELGKEKKSKSHKKEHSDRKKSSSNITPTDLKNTPAEDTYEIGKEIGGIQMGGDFYSSIKEGKDKASGKEVILKYIKKADNAMAKAQTESLRKEIQKLASFSHPNLIKVIEARETDTFFIIITEKWGKPINMKQKLTEKEAKIFTANMVEGLIYLHSQGVFGDFLEIKPEKIAIDSDGKVKIDDYGMNQSSYPTEDKLRSLPGGSKSLYIAPEVMMDAQSTPQADSWGLVSILYNLLAGYAPFAGDTEPQLIKRIMALDYQVTADPWPSLSPEIRDLIKHTLVMDTNQRWTVEKIKESPWLKS